MNSDKFEIYFVLASRFPTKKAYGVTTENTARAATELGHRSSIITPELGEKDVSTLNVLIVGSSISQYLLSSRLRKVI